MIKSTKDNAVYIEKASEQGRAEATVTFNVNPSEGNTLTLNELTFTFKASPSGATDVQIGATINESLSNLVANENLPTEATYEFFEDELIIRAVTPGDAGNNYTIASNFITPPSNLHGGNDVNFVGEKQTEVKYAPVAIGVSSLSTTIALKSYTPITEGDAVILEVDGSLIKGTLGAVTGTDPYQADISSFGLSSAPTRAWFDGYTPSVSIDVEDEFQRCVCRDTELTKVSSTLTEFVGTSTQSGMLKAGDRVILDGNSIQEPVNDIFGDSSCLATYTMQSDGTDLSGNYDCVENQALPLINSPFGKGVYFDGDTKSFIGKDIISDFKLTTMSVSFWMKVSDTIGNFALSNHVQDLSVPNTNSGGFAIGHIYGKLYMNYALGAQEISTDSNGNAPDNATAIAELIGSTDIPLNEWVHVYAEIDSTTAKIYMNGSLEGSITTTNPIVYGADSTSAFTIGGMYLTNDTSDAIFPFKGGLAQLRIFNRTLSESEISSLYAAAGSNTLLTNVVEIPGEDGVTHDIFNDGSAVATYTLDGNANDLGGNYNGTATDITYGSGKFGQAGVWDTSTISAKVDTGINNINTGNCTFSCWASIYDDGDEKNSAGLIGAVDQTNGKGRTLGYKTYQTTGIEVSFAGAVYNIGSGSTWKHYVGVADGVNSKLYVDGVEVSSISNYDTNNDYIAPNILLGQYFTNYEYTRQHLEGSLDQVRIFNRALSADEVSKLYNSLKYTLTFPSQAQAPTTCTIPDRSTQLSVVTDVLITDNGVNTHDIFGDGSAVATYQLNGDATDLGGNYDGTATDVTYSTSKFVQAAVFNGSSSKITTSILPYGESPYTFSLWLNPQITNKKSMIYMRAETPEHGDMFCEISGDNYNEFNWCHYTSGPTSNIVSTILSMNEFVHIVVCWTGSDLLLYKNASMVSTTPVSGYRDDYSEGSSDTFGYNRSYDDYYYKGQMDQVRIFNKALTQQEVTQLYNESAEYFKATYSDIALTGKGIQRKIDMPKADTIIVEPFTTQVYK